jgi:hypothetical protein
MHSERAVHLTARFTLTTTRRSCKAPHADTANLHGTGIKPEAFAATHVIGSKKMNRQDAKDAKKDREERGSRPSLLEERAVNALFTFSLLCLPLRP